MDFNDTPEEAAFRARARGWLEKNAEPLDPSKVAPNEMGEREDAATIRRCKAWQAKKADAGWACITWPKEYGGQDATPMQRVIFNQEEAKFRVPPNIYAIGHGMLGPTIMAHGSPEQKKRYLPSMLRGEEVWCQLFSEPAAGSDLAGLRTSAVKEGTDWLLNGQKIWSTGAHFCDWGMIVTRTDPSAAKHAGLTYFIVDMHSRGIEVRPIKQINGASGFNEVFFSNVRVPDSNRLGAVGDGWRVALTTLMNERVAIGAGTGSGRFKDLLRLAKQTRRNGRPAIEDSAVRQKLADFYVRSKGLQYTGYRTLSALSRGQIPGPEGSIGKAVGAPLGQQMAAFAVELQGALGAVADKELAPQEALWQEAYLSAPGLRIAGGTDEILKNIIAERVLRLPPEIRVDKEKPFRDIPSGNITK
ncbi:MAG TPA: acyl-CoA dehydrogenase [Deltaproteobacteria bacterium]|jgi:alkylation response protein AidB-like acyl-CoA dehydrogenase|nr:acyl-CoA dehydrogenase [Deltaproteobacteria bacterium]